MRFGAAAMIAIAMSSPTFNAELRERERERDRGPRHVPMPGRGEPVSLEQLVRIREKNMRRRKKRR